MAAQRPTYQAYTVVKRQGKEGAQDDFWLNIGAAFMHQDGEGSDIVLQALPINGKIVLRPPKAQAETRRKRLARPTCGPSRTAARSKKPDPSGHATKTALCQVHLKQPYRASSPRRGLINNHSKLQARLCLRLKLSPATQMRGAF